MSTHRATIDWSRDSGDFLAGRYSRAHTWRFDGGLVVPASPSPAVVPAPYSEAGSVDPEEAFVAAIASCHMLTFLYLASRQGWIVERYRDEAVGVMTRNEAGRWWVSSVTLSPHIEYAAAPTPSADDVARLHHDAHAECFIANSVKTEVIVTARP